MSTRSDYIRLKGLDYHGPVRHASELADKLRPVGRRCEQRGCITILSVYNKSTVCYFHAAAGFEEYVDMMMQRRESRQRSDQLKRYPHVWHEGQWVRREEVA